MQLPWLLRLLPPLKSLRLLLLTLRLPPLLTLLPLLPASNRFSDHCESRLAQARRLFPLQRPFRFLSVWLSIGF